MGVGGSDRTGNPARTRKRVGLAFVAVPFALFSLFAIGEAGTLEPGWWAHLVQVAGVALLLALAWRWPHLGGPALMVVGIVTSVFFLSALRDGLWERLLTVGLFFAPLIAGGIAFTLAGRARSAMSGPAISTSVPPSGRGPRSGRSDEGE